MGTENSEERLNETTVGISSTGKKLIVYGESEAIESVRAYKKALFNKRGWLVCLGVGDGTGNLFVHGDHESIKACQAKMESARLSNEQIAEYEKLQLLPAELAAGKATIEQLRDELVRVKFSTTRAKVVELQNHLAACQEELRLLKSKEAAKKEADKFFLEKEGDKFSAIREEFARINTTNSHPYIDLMVEYLIDACESPEPWKNWEFRYNPERDWYGCSAHVLFRQDRQYRRKSKTIDVGGKKIPEPVKSLRTGESYWLITLSSSCLVRFIQIQSTHTAESYAAPLSRGLIHETKEAAVAHAEAMLGITK